MRRFGRLFIFFVICIFAISLYGCGTKDISLEGKWQFESILYDGTEITTEGLKLLDWDLPTLICTKDEFTIDIFDSPISGTWDSSDEKQYRFIVDGEEAFHGILTIENNKQILTLRDTYDVQKALGHTVTMVFTR